MIDTCFTMIDANVFHKFGEIEGFIDTIFTYGSLGGSIQVLES